MDRNRMQELARTRQWAHQTLVEKRSKVYEAFLAMESVAGNGGGSRRERLHKKAGASRLF